VRGLPRSRLTIQDGVWRVEVLAARPNEEADAPLELKIAAAQRSFAWVLGAESVRYNPRVVTPSDRRTRSTEEVQADIALIERVGARDPNAITELYDRHSRLLYGLVSRILGHRGEAEEVLQEVFMAAWTRTETYRAELGSPVAWLVRIARNRAVDRLRSNAVRLRAAEAAPAEPVAAASPEADASTSEQRRTIARALDTLPAEQRVLIEHAFYLGLTHSELAERHGLPLGTVKTRIRTGMAALRHQLAPVYVEQ
jgi:RNA polymerase sigma-70 factor (ECF subfamily)